MRWAGRYLFIALGLGAAGLLLCDCGGIVWDGAYELTVTLEPAADTPVRKVWVASVSGEEDAEELIQTPKWADTCLTPVAFDGRPFVVQVYCGGHTSGLGREISYGQHRALLLRLEYADGHKQFKVVSVPDGRQSRCITVRIP